MISSWRTTISFFSTTALCACAALPPGAQAQAIERNPDGVTLHSPSGMLRVDVCSERVIRVQVSPTDQFPKSIVPSVIHSCGGAPFTVSSNRSTVSIRTSALRVEVDRGSGTVRFLTSTGQPVLSEQPHDGRTIVAPVTVDGLEEYRVRQDFLLTPGEAIYGLGQRQEGFLNLRDIPVRLLQANTNIAIPFLVSTNGYGLLWNSAALTNFNPANSNHSTRRKWNGNVQDGRRRGIRLFVELATAEASFNSASTTKRLSTFKICGCLGQRAERYIWRPIRHTR